MVVLLSIQVFTAYDGGLKIAGIPSPMDHPTVIAAADEKAWRKLNKPIQLKERISESSRIL